jgi:hypothetical protein
LDRAIQYPAAVVVCYEVSTLRAVYTGSPVKPGDNN